MTEKTVLVDVQQGVATLTMNRPKALNALNTDLAAELTTALKAADADDAVRCIVIAGAGKHFMAGGDIGYFYDKVQQGKEIAERDITAFFNDVHGITRAIRHTGKPVIAKAQGAVAGFGLSLLASCDLAVIADDCKFTLAYCHIATTPDGGSTFFLPRMLGLKKTMELMLLGDLFDAQEALNCGLVNKVVTREELDATTDKMSQRLAKGAAHALAETKKLVNQSLVCDDFETQLDAEQQRFVECTLTPDFYEGVQAFCEKRKPDFINKK